jgi:drug/metabolite transporter (DMT)-like permease
MGYGLPVSIPWPEPQPNLSSHPPPGGRGSLRLGLLLGLIGVVIFGITLPATRIAVLEMDPAFVTFARALIAAALAAGYLLLVRAALPPPDAWRQLAVFGLCTTIGYPLLMGIAMRYAPASHGGVVLAVQPLLTALASMHVAGERPSPAFWACSLAGTAAAITYTVLSSAGTLELHWADLLLAGAAAAGCYGYAVGGHLTQRMPGSHVISWALIVMAPLILALLLVNGVPGDLGTVSWAAWAALLFVGMFPMYLGFFAWNRGLAIGGIAKVGQMQLVQPFITLAAASALLGEQIGALELVFSVLVVTLVALGSRMRVAR